MLWISLLWISQHKIHCIQVTNNTLLAWINTTVDLLIYNIKLYWMEFQICCKISYIFSPSCLFSFWNQIYVVWKKKTNHTTTLWRFYSDKLIYLNIHHHRISWEWLHCARTVHFYNIWHVKRWLTFQFLWNCVSNFFYKKKNF